MPEQEFGERASTTDRLVVRMLIVLETDAWTLASVPSERSACFAAQCGAFQRFARPFQRHLRMVMRVLGAAAGLRQGTKLDDVDVLAATARRRNYRHLNHFRNRRPRRNSREGFDETADLPDLKSMDALVQCLQSVELLYACLLYTSPSPRDRG